MFENSFESMGRIAEKHSGKLIIAWIVIIVVLAPFASLLFGMTSYDVGSGIVPSNSMAVRAGNLLAQYFPGSAPSSNSSSNLVVVTTGTNINDASVISSYLNTESVLAKYLSGQGISGNVTSVITVENSTLNAFASGAREELNGTYSLIGQLNGETALLNSSLNQTLQMLYGLPALYLSYLTASGSPSYAYNMTALDASSSPVSAVYFSSFAFFFNSTIVNDTMLRASSSIVSAVTNSTSPYHSLLSSNPPLQGMSYSIIQNFTLGNFRFSTPGDRAHYDSFAYNYSFAAVVPSLQSNTTVNTFITDQLNTTVASFFEQAYAGGNAAPAGLVQQMSVSLTGHGLESSLFANPLIQVNSASMQGFLSLLQASSDSTTQLMWRVMQYSGFSGYPVVPTPYVMRSFVGYDNSTTIMVVGTSQNLTSGQTSMVQAIITSGFSTIGGSRVYISGNNVMNSQLATQTIDGMVRALIIGIVLSIIIVGIFFRSVVAAFLPLAMFAVSAMTAFSINALLYKYVLRSSISFITPTLLLILLLGLSTDYVVYIMSRYRNELRKGNPNPVIVSSKWAGHAVFTSGLTVSMSYIALWVSNVPIFSDSGITNAIGVLIAVIVANTLLVSILHRGRSRIFWPSRIAVGGRHPQHSVMSRLAKGVIDNRGKLLILFVIVSLVSTYYYYTTPTNMDVFSLLPAGSGVTAIKMVNQSFHGDYFDQAYVILQLSSPLLTTVGYNTSQMTVVSSVEQTLASDSHISAIAGPTYPYGYYVPYNLTGIPVSQQNAYKTQMNQYIGSDSRYVLITFQLSALAWTSYSSSFVNSIPSYLASHDGGTFRTYVGGLTEGLNNAYSFTDASFTSMIPILVFAILAVLAIQISALFTPMRLVLMVLASVVIALAITYVIIHDLYQLSLLIFLPMFTIITLLAVGLDYDIFMVSRVREEVMKGRSDEEGIRTSMTENGGVIITLGAVLFATFASLLFSGIGLIEEIGVGLALGVLIDTFISWPLFVPAVMLLLRRYNWWPSKPGLKHAGAEAEPDD